LTTRITSSILVEETSIKYYYQINYINTFEPLSWTQWKTQYFFIISAVWSYINHL